jgi:hypothetical protein
MKRWLRGGGGDGPRYVYVSYHKCATQYTERVLRAVCRHHGLVAATFDARHPSVPARALRRADFLLLTDYSSEMIDLGALDARGVHIVRDPRDTLVSMYFSHRSSHALNHEEIARDRAALASLDTSDGLDYLLRESGFFRRITRELEAWNPSARGYHETTFERLTADPMAEFAAILDSLGLTIERSALEAILERNRFETLRREWALRNPDAKTNHYRQGRAGDWRSHLAGDVKERFRARYGPLLIKLGYETSLDW